MSLHVLERLGATNPDCEIWWDASPLVYGFWKRDVLARAPAEKREAWEAQLTRLFDPENVRSHGRMGFRGVTTNPPLSLQALEADPQRWRPEISRLARDFGRQDSEGVYWALYLEIVRLGAEMIAPVFAKSGGRYGFLSGQVDPRLFRDGERMLEQGLQIARQGPNVMVKVPGSKEGYEVIEELTARGISTNNTTSFTVPQYLRCMDAVTRGLRRARYDGLDLSRWRSVITHMSARLGNLGDLADQATARGVTLTPEDVQHGELAVLKRAYRYGKATDHPSKMLQCSMRVSANAATGSASSWHIEKIAGGDFVYTCPGGYIEELMQVEDRLAPFDPYAIDEDTPAPVLEKLLKLPYFRQAFEYDGQRVEDFAQYGAFVATAAQFAGATRRTVDFVARALTS